MGGHRFASGIAACHDGPMRANLYEELPGVAPHEYPSPIAGGISTSCGEATSEDDAKGRKPLGGLERFVRRHRCARPPCHFNGLFDERRVAVAMRRASRPRHI